MAKTFKQCTLCGVQWQTREDFLADRSIRLEGYQWRTQQVLSGMPADGVLVYTHATPECGTSLTVAAKRFQRDAE